MKLYLNLLTVLAVMMGINILFNSSDSTLALHFYVAYAVIQLFGLFYAGILGRA